MNDNPQVSSRPHFSVGWVAVGYVGLAMYVPFAMRILYEETFLTWQRGPQMIGFSMAHLFPQLLIAGLLGFAVGAIWWLVSLVLALRRKRRTQRSMRIALIAWPAFIAFVAVSSVLANEATIRHAATTSHGPTYLIAAAATGDLRHVKYLLAHGLNVNTVAEHGTTPLAAAVNGGQLDMARYLISVGADVNARGPLGETPIFGPAEDGRRDLVDLLLAHGAAACTLDDEGHSAAGEARKYHHDAIANFLDETYHCKETATTCDDPHVSACVQAK
jgi:ankyrin repeat protein